MPKCSIWLIDRTISKATTPSQSEHESDGNKRVLHIFLSSGIIEVSPSIFLMSYLGHSLRVSYPSAEKQSLYSTAPAHRAIHRVKCKNCFISTNSVKHKYALFMLKESNPKKFSLAQAHSLVQFYP